MRHLLFLVLMAIRIHLFSQTIQTERTDYVLTIDSVLTTKPTSLKIIQPSSKLMLYFFETKKFYTINSMMAHPLFKLRDNGRYLCLNGLLTEEVRNFLLELRAGDVLILEEIICQDCPATKIEPLYYKIRD